MCKWLPCRHQHGRERESRAGMHRENTEGQRTIPEVFPVKVRRLVPAEVEKRYGPTGFRGNQLLLHVQSRIVLQNGEPSENSERQNAAQTHSDVSPVPGRYVIRNERRWNQIVFTMSQQCSGEFTQRTGMRHNLGGGEKCKKHRYGEEEKR